MRRGGQRNKKHKKMLEAIHQNTKSKQPKAHLNQSRGVLRHDMSLNNSNLDVSHNPRSVNRSHSQNQSYSHPLAGQKKRRRTVS